MSDDRRQVTLYLSAYQAAGLLAAIRAEGEIAVGFMLPSTHRAFQLKGTDARCALQNSSSARVCARAAAISAGSYASMRATAKSVSAMKLRRPLCTPA